MNENEDLTSASSASFNKYVTNDITHILSNRVMYVTAGL